MLSTVDLSDGLMPDCLSHSVINKLQYLTDRYSHIVNFINKSDVI